MQEIDSLIGHDRRTGGGERIPGEGAVSAAAERRAL